MQLHNNRMYISYAFFTNTEQGVEYIFAIFFVVLSTVDFLCQNIEEKNFRKKLSSKFRQKAKIFQLFSRFFIKKP